MLRKIHKTGKIDRGKFCHQNLNHNWGERTLIMGIVNVTPDSFSGDGKLDATDATTYALAQIKHGADIIDIGAESTRPGFTPIDSAEELARIIPVIEAVRINSNTIISVDTTKSDVLKSAVSAGANILNSIWGLTPELLETVRDLKIPVVLMHNKNQAVYDHDDVVAHVVEQLKLQAESALKIGIQPENIILDPGIGFGKTAEHNFPVMRDLAKIVALGFPTLLGPSRKSFIGKITGKPATERVFGSAAAVALGIAAGIDIVRVHDVAQMVDVVKMSDAITRGWRPESET